MEKQTDSAILHDFEGKASPRRFLRKNGPNPRHPRAGGDRERILTKYSLNTSLISLPSPGGRGDAKLKPIQGIPSQNLHERTSFNLFWHPLCTVFHSQSMRDAKHENGYPLDSTNSIFRRKKTVSHKGTEDTKARIESLCELCAFVRNPFFLVSADKMSEVDNY